jgi:hypothetical protein
LEIIAGTRALADVTMDDWVRVFLLAVIRSFLRSLLARFEMDSLIVVQVLEVGQALLGLELQVALPVLVAGVGNSGLRRLAKA